MADRQYDLALFGATEFTGGSCSSAPTGGCADIAAAAAAMPRH
ncbi:MAG TPA: hypothetical protein VNS60_14575 [Solirubrobacterales bacterium]|nr:hypothetical protein [Solirubrobacterales bacterium]